MQQKVEAGIERLAFGRRWQGEAERKERLEQEGEAKQQPVSSERSVTKLDNDGRLRKLATTSKQGLLVVAAEENGLRRPKENILKLYDREKRRQNLSRPGHKLTRQEKKDLSDLREDTRIVVEPSDKSKGFVLMSRENYVNKVAEMLGNYEDYEQCERRLKNWTNRQD